MQQRKIINEIAIETMDDDYDFNTGMESQNKHNCFNKLVISRNSTWKVVFDIVMLFVSCYNIFGNAYFSAFEITEDLQFLILDQVVESMFLMDMIFNFCQEYLDEESYMVISDIKVIAKHYMRRSFIFDLLAWIPFEFIFGKYRLYRLFKLLRLPRLAELLNVEKVK